MFPRTVTGQQDILLLENLIFVGIYQPFLSAWNEINENFSGERVEIICEHNRKRKKEKL